MPPLRFAVFGRASRRLSWILLLCLAVGCAEADTAAPIICQNDAECPAGQVCRSGQCALAGARDGGAIDGGVADGGQVDGGIEDGGVLDGGVPDGGTEDGGTPDAGTGVGFGGACGEHGDCESQICLQGSTGSFCTRMCSDDCPVDYVCKAFVLPPNRIVNLCIPFGDVYCVPCEDSGACPSPGDKCSDVGGATYCTRDCSSSGACPPGFACQDVPFSQTAEGRAATLDGGTSDGGGTEPVFRQCVPTGGLCPGCIDRDGDRYGVGADCLGPDCDDRDSAIHPGAAEICDGRDNNCNGERDEGFDLSSDNNNCGQCGLTCDQGLGQRCCAGTCQNVNTSLEHCGGCGHPCTGEGAACCSGVCQETKTDPAHCGGCGQACENPHGSLACEAGDCRPTCTPGFADCDQNLRNGCETATTTADNCGACGVTCTNAHGTAACTGGMCTPSCDSGWGNCDGEDRNGCETDLLTTTNHCNRCGRVCTNDHGTTSCNGGACQPVCLANWGDCDSNAQNGCETDLGSNVQACGACDVKCTNEHGTTACQGGVCTPTCEANYQSCDGNPRNGCETNLQQSVIHCGACNQPCTNAHGTTSCALGTCAPSCLPGYGDCNGNPNDGCESSFASTTAHCGACNQPCLNPHGTTACVDSGCTPACEIGWGDCDANRRNGCETDVRVTTAHCGSCGAPCVNPNGVTRCEASQCIPTCAPGFFDCNGNPRDGCEANLAEVTVCNTCQRDNDCPGGFFCHQNVCTKKKPLGEACAVGVAPEEPGHECQSDFCTDGVCCENDCVGGCRSCRLAATRGLCTFVAAGDDPDGECTQSAASTCKQDGTCDGAGACRLWLSGTECLAVSCATGLQTNSRICDGFGNCSPAVPATTQCAPYVCNANTSCHVSCTTDAECAAGYSCAGGVCKVSGGQPCTGPTDCATGNCADGVCCNEPCNGLCERCDLGVAVGTCTALPAGTDPDSECAKDPVSTCGLTGSCSGTRGSCERYPLGTVCQVQACATGVQSNPRSCDGAGTCVVPTPDTVSCFPYVCNGATQSCFANCATDAECAAGYGCATGACKKVQGQACGDDSECKSNFCTDGVCCESRCDGSCEKCNRDNRLGHCDAVPAGQDPDQECEAQAASTCGRTGMCSGARSCALHPPATVCVAAFCSGNVSHPADTCDGNGTCTDGGTQTCAPYACNPDSGLCRTACSVNTDCISGFECAAGVCRKSAGEACGGDGECATNFCTDGVCCLARCGGVCERCDLTNRKGFCDPSPSGSDPDDECPTEALSTCGRTGVCSGSRSCQLYASGTVCVAASCATVSTANIADTCNGSGTCLDSGVQDCAPYICAANACKTSCTVNEDCVAGYGCKVATGQCLRNDGEVCADDGQCLHGSCCSGFCRNLLVDPTHCGACGTICANDHGTTSCVSGLCTPVCATGYASCDNNVVNGCETELATTTAHCGTCGRACTNEHGTTACSGGQCAPSCAGGYGDCDGNTVNGCETNTLQSVLHCGSCGVTCVNDHGTTSCSNGTCAPACQTGYGDCDANPRNGCETDINSTTAHCGTCNQPCANPHGTTSCQSGTCAPVCQTGYGDCDANPRNGCETDTNTTTAHCGGCNAPCINPNGTTLCNGGACVPTCAPGFYDCNGNPRDGCEADLSQVTTCNACTVDGDCPGGFYCNGALCTKKKPLGDTCTVGTAPQAAGRECLSNFCIDDVCCENDCTGLCRSCRLPTTRGLCSFIGAGADPDVECGQSATSTCGQDGACDGSGACRLWASGTQCLAQSCTAGEQTNSRDCDGSGTCKPANPPTTLCVPYVCNGTTGCFTSCGTDAQCAAGYSCVAGVCKVSGGQPCDAPSECASNQCVDGVCCNEACGALCERCNLPGTIGTCTAIPAGTDPEGECAAQDPSTCGLTGVCSGARGSCALHTLGTVCAAQTCQSGLQTNPRTCDGSGTCVTPNPANVACTPYVCNATTQSCFTGCATDAECITGYGCAGGACKKLDGESCNGDTECKSGFCTDGVCCKARCDGTCEKCNLTGRLGFCDPVTSGQDPDAECDAEAVGTCGRTGQCSGSRSCALHPSGTVCLAASCAGNTSNLAHTCNGTGTCQEGGTQACSPLTCDAATGLCRTSCSVATDCIAGYDCVGGVCKKSRGQPCGGDTECASNFCTDGVCCEGRCNGVCEKCNLSGRVGFCDPVAAGQDPDTECAQDPVSSCQRTGACSGARSCALYASGTVCNAAACVGNVSSLADTCNGSGTCVDGGSQACLPYICDGGSGLCKTSCSTGADCQSGYECTGGVCKKSQGGGCNADGDCATNFCTDGVCCNARCNGVCESCDQTGRAGFCDAIPAGTDPGNECATDPVSSCDKNGLCSGSRSCALYPPGTVCQPAQCTGNVSSLADTCNGSGTCVDAGTQNCLPYVCNQANGICKTSCTVNADCQSGYECAGGLCKKSRGATCGFDSECASNFCTDGVCCDGRCHGVCEKCNQSGRLGFCDPVSGGTDPDNECATDPVASCGKTGVCSGARTCSLYGAGTVCQGPSCATGSVANLPDTCSGSGTCNDGGQQNCSPYTCNSGSGACRTSCSSDTHCVTGYRCDVGSGQCLKRDGEACGSNNQCYSGACCSGFCRDLSTDESHCGSCTNVCVAQNGTNTCLGGNCTPSCSTGYGNCDSNNNNGCETSLRTNTNCGACGVLCDYAHASESCSTGTCTLTACDSSYSNCDGSQTNGCEVYHKSYANSCGAPGTTISFCADDSSGFLCPYDGCSTKATRTGRTNQWFRVRANECSDCCADVESKVNLTPPAGTDYDLFVYTACGTLLGSSQNAGSAVDSVTIYKEDGCFGDDTSFDYWIEVRHWSGASCSNWSLAIQGGNCR